MDGTDILVLRSETVTVSRLAPYPGWCLFFENAKTAWRDLRRSVEKPIIDRIGLRFINRIDAQRSFKGNLSSLVNISPTIPALSSEPLESYFVQVAIKLTEGMKVIINSQPMESPVPECIAVLVDIDISIDENLPLRDDEMWALIGRMRTEKNRVFEALITDAAREIFQL